MDQSALHRRVRLLSLYAYCSSAVMLVLVAGAFVRAGAARFEVIDVDRINVVGPDGKYAVVIANAGRENAPSLPSTFVTMPVRPMLTEPRPDDAAESAPEDTAADSPAGARGEPHERT